MATAPRLHDRTPTRGEDQRVFLHEVSWKQYESILATRGERPVPRLTYLEGELELMSPSIDHEMVKKTIARLVEAYADESGLPLIGYGSWTLKRAGRRRAAEADECYVLGTHRPKVPNLAIEVIWTGGGIDKLEVYRGLGVGEVWMWKKGRIDVHLLRGDRYEPATKSRLLPDLDLGRVAAHCALPDQAQAVRAFRAWVRKRSHDR